MSESQALVETSLLERQRRSRVARSGFDGRLRAELLLLDALFEYVHRVGANDATPRPAPSAPSCSQVLTPEGMRQQRELDGLALVRLGGPAVCQWLTCPQCRRGFPAVAVPPGAKFCRRCAAPKPNRRNRIWSRR